LPTKATGASPRVPAHDHGSARPCRTLRHPQKRAHAELGHGLDVEDLDVDTELSQFPGAAGKLLGIEHVRWLIDEVTGEVHPVDHMRIGRKGFPGGRDILDSERDIGPQAAFVAILLLGLVTVKPIGAEPNARRDGGGLIRQHRPAWQLCEHGHRIACAIQLARQRAAELQQIPFPQLRCLARSDDEQALNLDSLGLEEIEYGAAFSFESTCCSRPFDQIGSAFQYFARGGTEPHLVVAKHHQGLSRCG
jgi:hypothetical protein